MKKLYSFVLMATMLLIGTNAWADGKIENVRTGEQYEHLNEAFAAAQDGDTLQLTDDMNESIDSTAWFGEPTSGTLENYASTDRSITLDLKGNLYNFTSTPKFCIAHTRGVLRIKSTGGEGEIRSNKGVIVVYGSYLKINAETKTPLTHLIIEKDVKITSGTSANGDQYRGIQLECFRPYQATDIWKWKKTPCDFDCEIFPTSQYGVSNGARVDIYGTVEGDKYAFQVSGNVRSAREYLKEDGTYNSDLLQQYGIKGCFPLYHKKSASSTELYLPGTTLEGKTPTSTSASNTTYYRNVQGANEDYVLYATDDALYSSYIHIHSGAVLKTSNTHSKNSVAYYSSGYARCYIEGTCEGSTGVYVKSGDVELHDATITSNYEDPYSKPVDTTGVSGVQAGGSAIVIDSNTGWTGNIEVTISGDTHVSTNNGYAIDEEVTNGGTNVNYLTITGGTFEGGQVPVVTPNADDPSKNDTTWVQGTMHVSQPTLDANNNPDTITTITIIGAEVQGATNIGEGENQITLEDFLNGSDSHITYVTDENNNTTMIVSQGAEPETDPDNVFTTWDYIAENQGSTKSYQWTKIENDEIAANETVVLDELQINSGSALNGLQQLTIHNGATLKVDRLIMNAYARIIVEAGGKLIVKGTQGISAPSIQNITLQASETEQAIFLFHPNVTSNRHPNATVEFISNSITNLPAYSKQRFGIPTWKKLSSITTKNGGSDVQTAISSFSYANNEWTDVSWINVDGKDENLGLIADPFAYYQMQHNTPNVGTVVTMKGELYGNTNPTLSILGNSWNGYANSYMAPIDAHELIQMIPNTVDKSFQIYELSNTPGEKGSWVPVSELDLEDIKPMQAFLLRNTMAAANVTVNYGDAVYYPTSGETKPSSAPARRSELNNITKAKLIVKGESYVDRVVVAEDAQFSAAFDNGYDVAKYMNDGINLYVSADEKMGIYATDDIENTYLGFQAVNGGNYTIEFTNVQGKELTLIDHENNVRVAIEEGKTYAFTAAANSVNDYRFEIVGRADMPTAIENTEAVKSAKGIYTITGQYVGEMNVWNSLPAGIYVVNGEKLVK